MQAFPAVAKSNLLPRDARSRRWIRRAAAPLSLLVLTFTLSGCLGSGYHYIAHRNSDGTLLGFKIPANWTTFSTQQVLEAANGPITNSEAKQIADGEWMTVFSSVRRPASADFFKVVETSSTPIGIVTVQPLGAGGHDELNYSLMRSEFLGTDPFSASTPDPYNVVAYNEFLGSGGLRGSSMTTDVKLADGSTATLAQIVEVDPTSEWVMALGIGCKAGCYGPNSGVIRQILDSWALKEVKS